MEGRGGIEHEKKGWKRKERMEVEGGRKGCKVWGGGRRNYNKI